MGVPKGRRTKSKQGSRRSHIKLLVPFLSRCKECGKPVLPHRACENCGFYKGRRVLDVFAKLSKRERKAKLKALEESSPEQK